MKKGHTLLEMMIACSVASICALGILALVKAGVRYLLVTEAKTTLQKDAILAMRRLSDEFSETNDASFNIGNSTNGSVNRGVVFANPRDPVSGEVSYDPAGRMYWPKLVCYFVKVESNVQCIARNVTLLPIPKAFPPPVDLLDTYLGNTSSTPSKIVARNVALFELTNDASIMALDLKMELPSNYGRKYGFQVKTQIFIRN
ncbi:MAG: prepilin-type N-terminal cleavage/methylation domain-containing protein [Candidatus Eremiobacteraeota bacterium]|nr:prepilin-type N-terminal cleavage/methylation domain-containing protein [Candidatus Eremiobacteraeota bacterium]MCW5868472.1 prepilin-type N-terminal cleavage/methylation domain-containing protein [Candidatus Eremiobacteraeota bacterium]